MVTGVSPGVWLLGSQTGVIVSVYSASFPIPLIMAVDPLPCPPALHGLKIQDWPIIELHHSGNHGWSQVWHRTQAEAIESSTEILCWLGESAAFSSGFSWWLLLAPFPTAWSRAFSDRRQARTYREAEGRRWSGSPCVCSHKPQFLQLFL